MSLMSLGSAIPGWLVSMGPGLPEGTADGIYRLSPVLEGIVLWLSCVIIMSNRIKNQLR